VTREYFTGHKASIVFFGFIDNHSHMISLDESGLLLEWPYKQDHYSSYGWFKPEKMLQLGMTLRMSCLDPSQVKVHCPPPGLSVGSGADAVRGGRRRGRSKPPPSAGAGPGGDGEYSATYLRQSERYDHLFLSGLRAVHPWCVRREENGHVIRMYGERVLVHVAVTQCRVFNMNRSTSSSRMITHEESHKAQQTKASALVASKSA